jgi:hypothetical protein
MMKQVEINGKKVYVTENGEDKMMGCLFWYTIGGCVIPIEELKKKWRDLGLDEDFMPKDPRMTDAFMTATKDIECDERVLIGDQEAVVTYRVESMKGSETARHVIRIVKSKDKDKQYEAVDIGKWEINKHNGEITSQEFTTDIQLRNKFKQMTIHLEEKYHELMTNFTENDIRTALRSMIYKMPYIMLRPSGAVYFVPKECVETIKKMSLLMKWINEKYSKTSFKSEMWYVPVQQENRDMIYEKFQDDVLSRINDMLNDIADIVKDPDRKIYPSKYKSYCDEFEHLVQTYVRYKEMLDDEIESVKVKCEILRQSIFNELMKKVSGS